LQGLTLLEDWNAARQGAAFSTFAICVQRLLQTGRSRDDWRHGKISALGGCARFAYRSSSGNQSGRFQKMPAFSFSLRGGVQF